MHWRLKLREWLPWVPYFILPVATIISVGIKTRGNVAVVVFMIVVAALAASLIHYAQQNKQLQFNRNATWAANALLLEALFWMWTTIVAQLIITGLLLGFLFLRATKGFLPSKSSLLAWLILRAVAITVSKAGSPKATWYVSQLLLLGLLGLHVAARINARRTQFALYRPPIIATTLTLVFLLYSSKGTMPPRIYILVVMAPLVYFITLGVQTPVDTPFKTFSQETATIVVVMTCIAVAMAWDHETVNNVEKTNCNRLLYNTRECLFPNDVVAGHTKCCCIEDFQFVTNTPGCARKHCAFTQKTNTKRFQQGQTPIDCCGHEIFGTLNDLRAGPDMCMCGNTKEHPKANGFSVSGAKAKCACAVGTAGPFCEQTGAQTQ